MRFLWILLGFFALTSFKMADRIIEGKKGDYIVTEQDRNYSLLFIKDMQKDTLLFEEISIPTHLIDLSTVHWKDWLQKGALGHTSWIQYEIDSVTFQLMEGYSFSKRGWLYLDESDHFLSKLITLSLNKVPETDRKKIGPAPRSDEPDYRKAWTPPLFLEGKKIKASCEAWKTLWPKDDSLLSNCQIMLYFPPKEISIFPSWIEASNGHFSYAVKIIDSGREISSPLNRTLPHRPPQILRHVQQTKDMIELPIKASPYYKSFSLFTFDIMLPQKRIGPIPFTLKKTTGEQDLMLSISKKDLSLSLLENHRYKWVLLPEGPEAFSIESEDFFKWAP